MDSLAALKKAWGSELSSKLLTGWLCRVYIIEGLGCKVQGLGFGVKPP